MCDWKHIYQRISKQENSKGHNQCCEAYFMHIQKRDVGSLLMENQMHQQREEVKKNRLVLEKIFEVCKVIGKRGCVGRDVKTSRTGQVSAVWYPSLLQQLSDQQHVPYFFSFRSFATLVFVTTISKPRFLFILYFFLLVDLFVNTTIK